MLSSTGDSFSAVALPLVVYRVTGSVGGMAMVTAFIAGGRLVGGVFSGAIVDRSPRRTVMVWTDVARAVTIGSIPILAWCGLTNLPVLCGVGFLIGLLGSLFFVAYAAFVPEMVTKARVIEANAKLNASIAVTFVVGPALAGLAAQRWAPETAIGLDAVTFLASVLSLLALRGRWRKPAPVQREQKLVGARYLASAPALRTVTLMVVVEAFATAPAVDMFTFHVKSRLGQSDLEVGVMFAIAALGAVAGASLLPSLKRRLGSRGLFVGTAAILAGTFAAMAGRPSTALTCVTAAVFMFSATIRRVLSNAGFQHLTPDPILGRVMAAFWLILDVSRSAGAASIGYVAQRHGSATAFAVIGCSLLVPTLLAITSRSLRDLDSA